MTEDTLQIVKVPVVNATAENVAEYGLFIGTDVPSAGVKIPFYKGRVEEGHNLPFECTGKSVVRSARISKRSSEVVWLERHVNMTQLFIGLGDQPFAMVLGKPHDDSDLPDVNDVRCFIIPPGHGVMIHKGTWHDFPLCVKEPVTTLTVNSEEVVEALIGAKEPAEMNRGDVFKINVKNRTGKCLIADI